MTVIIYDKAHADWCERIEETLEYAHGEVRATIQQIAKPGEPVSYWTRTDYLLQQVRDDLDALHRSLAGSGEYTPPEHITK